MCSRKHCSACPEGPRKQILPVVHDFSSEDPLTRTQQRLEQRQALEQADGCGLGQHKSISVTWLWFPGPSPASPGTHGQVLDMKRGLGESYAISVTFLIHFFIHSQDKII